MQLILHIGTHKTGTSAVQECLYRNERILAERGIYYAHRPRARTLNQLAQLIASGQSSEARALVDSHLAKARAHGATTFLISAESFFAMTMFFHKLEGDVCENYWEAESRAVELLHSVLPADMAKQVVVFFRRQDKFLESVYAQTVRTRPVSATCEQFAASVSEVLDYARHMRLWSRVFPDCVVHTYEETANAAARFFLGNVLKIGDLDRFEGLDLRINTSLARDLVEYKRELNKATSFVDRRMGNFVCAELERVVADDGRYHDYLSARGQGETLARRRARQRDAQPGFRHEAVSSLVGSGFQRADSLSRSLAGAGEGAPRAPCGDQADRALSARARHSAAAASHQAAPRDVCFRRFRSYVARHERRRTPNLQTFISWGATRQAALTAGLGEPQSEILEDRAEMDLRDLQRGGDVLQLLALFPGDPLVGKQHEISGPDHLFLGV